MKKAQRDALGTVINDAVEVCWLDTIVAPRRTLDVLWRGGYVVYETQPGGRVFVAATDAGRAVVTPVPRRRGRKPQQVIHWRGLRLMNPDRNWLVGT